MTVFGFYKTRLQVPKKGTNPPWELDRLSTHFDRLELDTTAIHSQASLTDI